MISTLTGLPLRGYALFDLRGCGRIDADAEPGEAIADALPDFRGMLADAAGEQQTSRPARGVAIRRPLQRHEM